MILALLVAAQMAKGPIVFVGSSIFHRWTQLAAQMAPLPITNIAFDGAVTDDWNRLLEPRVIPLRPRVVVYYCGSNDVDGGESAEQIAARIRWFADRLHASLPETRFVFVSVNRAPEKRDRWDVVDGINGQMQTYARTNPHVQFVDVNPALVNAGGSPRMEFFMNDRLHLRPAAYEEFTRILKPALEKAIQ